jgi:hypothetical protein
MQKIRNMRRKLLGTLIRSIHPERSHRREDGKQHEFLSGKYAALSTHEYFHIYGTQVSILDTS